MTAIDLKNYLPKAIEAAEIAGRKILEIYHSADFDVILKSDNSPLTIADQEAHKIIAHIVDPSFPILSEEGKEIEYDVRRKWESFWLVDPLDGTKEFINRNGEFTVNIALIHKNYPVLGVVYCPVLDKTYWGIKDHGSFVKAKGIVRRLTQENKVTSRKTRIVSSRLHTNLETIEFIGQFPDAELVSMGSSLKFMLLAEGQADIYPRYFPTMEWDTAASQIILEESGGEVIDAYIKEPLRYNKEDLLNPHFIARGKSSFFS